MNTTETKLEASVDLLDVIVPARARPQSYARDYDEPLPLGIPAPDGVAVGSAPRARRPVVWVFCPKHVHQGRRTGLVRQGGHLIYRLHYITTYGGARRPCVASGAAVCEVGVDLAAHRHEGLDIPSCACGAHRKDLRESVGHRIVRKWTESIEAAAEAGASPEEIRRAITTSRTPP